MHERCFVIFKKYKRASVLSAAAQIRGEKYINFVLHNIFDVIFGHHDSTNLFCSFWVSGKAAHDPWGIIERNILKPCDHLAWDHNNPHCLGVYLAIVKCVK